MGARSRLAQAYYDMATLLDAGVPILRSLDIVIQGRAGYLKRTFTRMRESLSQGSSLSESMDQHRNVFPDMDRMLVEAAETSGSLGESFKMLSQWHEFMHRIVRRTQMGLLYPVLMLHLAACVFGLPNLVLGKVTISGYFVQVLRVLLLLYIPVIVVVASMLLRNRIPLVRLPLDFVALRIPILGQAIYHVSVSRYATAFTMLYKAGVPIAECTRRATRATGNVIVASLFAGAERSVREGGLASDGLSSRLPAEYRDLWRIGEETGELDKTTAKVGQIAADRADLFFHEFARWLPIVIWAVMAVILVLMIFKMARQIPSFSGDLGI